MLPLSLTMQQEDEEDERADQIEAGIKDKAIPAGDHDEPMRMDEGKASILEDELASEGARMERHVDTRKGEISCSNMTTIGADHMEESTAELVVTNQ